MGCDIKDKVVLITGGATGIGAAAVRVFVEAGAKHVGILDLAEEAGVALQEEINTKYGTSKVNFHKVDVTSDDQLFGAFKSVLDEHDYIDVVINNAGIMNDSLRLFKKEIEVNVTALITATLKAIELMRKDKGGKGGTVINISSTAGLSQTPYMPVYWATKAAVIQFSNCIGHEENYSKTGVRVLTVCPGATDTALISKGCLGSYDPEHDEALVRVISALPRQSAETAARGLLQVYEKGESASTWLVACNNPADNITDTITAAYGLMEERAQPYLSTVLKQEKSNVEV